MYEFNIHQIFFNYSVASWFISPLLSGFMSGVLFILIRMFILKKVSEAAVSYYILELSLVLLIGIHSGRGGRRTAFVWLRPGTLDSKVIAPD